MRFDWILLIVCVPVCVALSLPARAGEPPTCKKGQTLGCYKAAEAYARGEGVERDLKKAASYFGVACQSGHARGCYNAALLYDMGQGMDRDAARAARFYGQACSTGFTNGCASASAFYRTGEGVKKDTKKAAGYAGKGCADGDSFGCVELGLIADADGDPKAAARHFAAACEQDAGEGCYRMGAAHLQGRGVKKSTKKAGKYLERACKLKHPQACYSAGMLALKNGDEEDSALLLKRGCELGLEQACAALSHE